MKKYLYWTLVGLVAALGLYLIANSSLEPQSVPKIRFSEVETPERFGEAVFQRMREEVREAPLVFLGVTPRHSEDISLWKGFLEAAAKEPGYKYDMVVVEPALPFIDQLPYQMKIDIKEETDRFVEGVKNALAKHLRIAVVVPTVYSTQVLKYNPAWILRKDKGLSFTSFSISKFPVTHEQEKVFEPRCSVDSEDPQGTGALGCMIRAKSRSLYRKKREPGKYSGLMDQSGEHDYLILFNRN
jgi:hypothetical protein